MESAIGRQQQSGPAFSAGSSAEEGLAAVRRAYDAYRRKDFPAILALLAPEVELVQTELLPWGGTFRGPDGAQRFFAKLGEAIDSEVAVEQLIPAGEQVVAVGRSRGTVRASGAAFDVPAVHVWTLRGGRAVRFEAYIDTPAMLRALGSH